MVDGIDGENRIVIGGLVVAFMADDSTDEAPIYIVDWFARLPEGRVEV